MNTTDRIRRYMESLPAAVSGARGHDALFRAACILSHGFALPDEEAWPILQEYNARCLPPWSERELRHKLTQAHTVAHSKPRGHLAGNAMPPRRPDPTEQPPRVLWRVTLDGTEHIALDHLKAAEAVWKYCSESARWAFMESRFSRNAQSILNALEQGPLSLAQISRDVFNKNVNRNQISDCIREIENEIIIEKQTTGGRDATVISLRAQPEDSKP